MIWTMLLVLRLFLSEGPDPVGIVETPIPTVSDRPLAQITEGPEPW